MAGRLTMAIRDAINGDNPLLQYVDGVKHLDGGHNLMISGVLDSQGDAGPLKGRQTGSKLPWRLFKRAPWLVSVAAGSTTENDSVEVLKDIDVPIVIFAVIVTMPGMSKGADLPLRDASITAGRNDVSIVIKLHPAVQSMDAASLRDIRCGLCLAYSAHALPLLGRAGLRRNRQRR